MASRRRVAVVTGGNKGIGLEIVRSLCKKFDGDTILAARNEKLGKEAVKLLERQDEVEPVFHQLDVTDIASIEQLHSFLQMEYGGLDILVNNAGIMFKTGSQEPLARQVKETMAVNFRGCLNCCKLLFPLLRPGARVVNLTSMYCRSTLRYCAPSLKARFTSMDMTMPELEQLMADYEKCAKAGKCQVNGWPTLAYGVSKIGVTVMTQIQQREVDEDRSKEDILINTCCPGWCNTDMGGQEAPKTAAQGADTPVYLALLSPGTCSPRGVMCSNRTIQKWD